MTNEIQVFDMTPLLWCGLAVVGWVGMACLQRFVLPVSIRGFAHGPRLGLAFATWFFAIDALSQVLETATHRPHWLIALSAALASEAALICYRWESLGATSSQQVKPLLHSASNEVSMSGRDVRAPGSAGVPPAHSSARQCLTSDRRHFVSTLLPVLRLALIAVLSVLLLEPVLTHEDEHEEEHAVAVVVDVSDSMNLPARLETDPDRSRSQSAHQLLVGILQNRTDCWNACQRTTTSGCMSSERQPGKSIRRSFSPERTLGHCSNRVHPTGPHRPTSQTHCGRCEATFPQQSFPGF